MVYITVYGQVSLLGWIGELVLSSPPIGWLQAAAEGTVLHLVEVNHSSEMV